MATQTSTRRAVLGAIAAMSAGALIAAPAHATNAIAVSPEFRHLLADALRADAIASRYDRAVYQSTKRAFDKAVATIPHHSFPQTQPGYDGSNDDWTTENAILVRHARASVARKVSFAGPGSDQARAYHMDMRRLVAADKMRERARNRIRRSLGLDRAVERSNDLSDRACRLFDAMIERPANNIADVHLKLQQVSERDPGCGWANDAILADLARFMSGEA